MARAFQFDVGPVVEQLNRILQPTGLGGGRTPPRDGVYVDEARARERPHPDWNRAGCPGNHATTPSACLADLSFLNFDFRPSCRRSLPRC